MGKKINFGNLKNLKKKQLAVALSAVWLILTAVVWLVWGFINSAMSNKSFKGWFKDSSCWIALGVIAAVLAIGAVGFFLWCIYRKVRGDEENDHTAHWLDKKDWDESTLCLKDTQRPNYAVLSLGASGGKIAEGFFKKKYGLEWKKESAERRQELWNNIQEIRKELASLQAKSAVTSTVEIKQNVNGSATSVKTLEKSQIENLTQKLNTAKQMYLTAFQEELAAVRQASEKLDQKFYAILGADISLTKNQLTKRKIAEALKNQDKAPLVDRKAVNEIQKRVEVTTINEGKEIETISAGSSLIIGGAGSGKTAHLVIPTILHNAFSNNRPCMVVADPKGELFEKTSSFVEKMGYTVYRFNTIDAKHSHSWNVLTLVWDLYYTQYLPAWHERYQLKNLIEKSGVAPTTTQEQQIVALTTIISDSKQKIDDAINTIVLTVYPMPKDGGGSNHFFYAMGQTYMKAFFTLPLDFGVSREEYNPYMCAFNAKQYGNNLVVLRDMLPEWSLAISNVAQLTAENIAAGEQNSSLQNAFDGMSIFTTETIKNLTSSSTIIFNDIIEKPTAIYVGIDTTTPDSPACRIASLFMSMMYQHLNEHLNKKASGKAFERPIHYIVDEFGNLPKMEFIQKIFSLDRSKNIVAYPVIQTDRQIKEIYGDNKFWEIINSANAVVIADVSDPQFAKMLADRAGTDFRKSVSHSTSAKGDVSSSESMHRTNEIEAGDIMNKDKFEFIVFLRRHKPYKFQINKIWETEWGKWALSFGVGHENIVAGTNYGVTISDHVLMFYESGLSWAIKKKWFDRVYSRDLGKNEIRDQIYGTMVNNKNYKFGSMQETQFYDEYKMTHGGYPCVALDIILGTNDSRKSFPIDERTDQEVIQPRVGGGIQRYGRRIEDLSANRRFAQERSSSLDKDGDGQRFVINREKRVAPPPGATKRAVPAAPKEPDVPSGVVGVKPTQDSNKELDNVLWQEPKQPTKKEPPSGVVESKETAGAPPVTKKIGVKTRPWVERSSQERVAIIVQEIKKAGPFTVKNKRFLLTNLDFLLTCRSLEDIEAIYGEYWEALLAYLHETNQTDILSKIERNNSALSGMTEGK